ncbi:MAG TPA: response regulator transcription factor [Candidatus Saccharimonadales bacterium]|nr:response regulator transcription factor [Candidatus Saccharimonadales bacterium]
MTVPSDTRPLRILVVDDEPAMVGAVSALVGSAGHQVVTAYDGDTALRRLTEERPDLVLLDLAMPGRDGVEVVRVARESSDVPIIILTGEADELAKVEALDAGADDYVTKPFGRQELLARIRAVLRRREGIPARTPLGVLRLGTLTIDTWRFAVAVDGRPIPLTPIEFALLASLVQANGRVVPHARLLAAGWAAEPDPDPQWLKPHLARLRSKLEAAGGPVPASVRAVGYRIDEG